MLAEEIILYLISKQERGNNFKLIHVEVTETIAFSLQGSGGIITFHKIFDKIRMYLYV